MRTVVDRSPISEYDASSWPTRSKEFINGRVEPTGNDVSGPNSSIRTK